MSLANVKFELPFEPGEPITFPITYFTYKTGYDKYYVLDGKEFMPRYEVALAAVKHGIFISKQETTPMERRAYTQMYKGRYNSEYDSRYPEPPKYFGMWLGRFIPILRNFSKMTTRIGVDGYTQQDAENLATSWCTEFFEGTTDFWFEMLMGVEHTNKDLKDFSKAGKPVWVCWDKRVMLIPLYQKLRAQGIVADPNMDAQIQHISRFIPSESEVQP